jgi:Zn-dependent peptidase ImmA (M78 family)
MTDIEAEANEFAMELLMPSDWLLADVRKMGGFDVCDDDKLAKLAKKYRVPVTLLTLRLGMLMEIKP